VNKSWTVSGAMGLIAVLLALAAAYYYPWPERTVANAQVNQKLFPNLDLDEARTLTLTTFDRDDQRFETVRLKRVQDAWFLASANDFPAGNTARRADVLDILSQATILEVKSTDDGSHQLYGVVDFEQITDPANQSGIGAKISLADNNNRSLADLIVGEPVGDDPDQRFVRVAGQPSVYVIQLPASLLTTALAAWVDHNLLDVKRSSSGAGLDVSAVQVDHYVLEGDAVTDTSATKYNYRAQIEFATQGLAATVVKPGEDGLLGEPRSAPSVHSQTIALMGGNLSQVQFTGVAKKPSAAIEAISAGPGGAGSLASLANFGFRRGTAAGQWLESKNGQTIISTSGGVNWTLNFGSVAPNPNATDAQIMYYLLITATANEAAFPPPAEPADPNNEDQKRDYERAVKRRDDNVARARNLASQYNIRHAPWLYLINEDALRALRPEESDLFR
jgi:hypothetical protein